jgi:hypothetical protein
MQKQSDAEIIFIFPYSLTAFDAQKFGFETLLEQNANLKVLDLSPLVSARNDKNAVFLAADYIKKINSYAELEEEIKNSEESAIYIDNINGINGFQWQGREIFRLFKKHQVRYVVVEVGALPIFTALSTKTVLNKIKKLFNLPKLLAYLKWRMGKMIVYYQWKLLRRYQLPEKIYIGNSEMRHHYVSKYSLDSSNVISIHSFDYDRYLNYLRSGKEIFFPNEKVIVFLDQMLATHCDFGKSVSFSPVTAENYLPALNNFFDILERRLGMKVVIAASPRADYENKPSIFGSRRIVSGKTLEVVAESALVLAHTTTALSFAVLFDKPILMLTTKEMSAATGYANFLDNMAASLKLTPLCIDDANEINKFNFEAYTQWPRNYDDYKYKYVMTENTEDKLTWEILLETLSKPGLKNLGAYYNDATPTV